jgi:hypothetical protein
MVPDGTGTKPDHAGEAQQQFTGLFSLKLVFFFNLRVAWLSECDRGQDCPISK